MVKVWRDTEFPGPEDIITPADDIGGGIQTPPEFDTVIPFWTDYPEVWDTVSIAGIQLPGICNVTANVKRKADIKNAKGVAGATISDDGPDASDVEITLLLHSKTHWKEYLSVVDALNPNTGKGKYNAVDVDHPALATVGIDRIFILELTSPVNGGIPQTKEVTIKAVGWLPPPPPAPSKSKTPKKSNREGFDAHMAALNSELEAAVASGERERAEELAQEISSQETNWYQQVNDDPDIESSYR